jgi:hypothetical protein
MLPGLEVTGGTSHLSGDAADGAVDAGDISLNPTAGSLFSAALEEGVIVAAVASVNKREELDECDQLTSSLRDNKREETFQNTKNTP